MWRNPSSSAGDVVAGREALRGLLACRGITFQRTKTWKASTGPDFDAKLDRIEYVFTQRPDRMFAFGAPVPPV